MNLSPCEYFLRKTCTHMYVQADSFFDSIHENPRLFNELYAKRRAFIYHNIIRNAQISPGSYIYYNFIIWEN